jgi:hypothetical protein
VLTPCTLPPFSSTQDSLLSGRQQILLILECFKEAEDGKVTVKSNGDVAFSDESLLKSNSKEELNDDFP